MASGNLRITFTDMSLPETGTTVFLAGADMTLGKLAAKLDKQSQGQVSRAAQVADFTGKAKSAMTLLAPAKTSLDRVILLGIGKPDKGEDKDKAKSKKKKKNTEALSPTFWLTLGGQACGRLQAEKAKEATILLDMPKGWASPDGEAVAEFALGLLLRAYDFKKYKTNDDETNGNDTPTLRRVIIACEDPKAARRHFRQAKHTAEAVYLTRDLVNEPANILGPEEFAARAESLSKLGVAVERLDEKTMRKLGMGALLAVGQGSARPSYLVVMTWQGAPKADAPPVVFVGKGVTFDTGGISLKPSQGMEEMKGDMGGAACVVGLLHLLAARKAKVNAVGIIGLVENMPSGTAQRPGDIVTAMNGKTIEVLNTDAEGRLVLADALCYAQDRFKPACLVNLATLTGAIMVALGKEYAGLFSNDDTLAEQLTAVGEATGEKVWRLPMGKPYDKLIVSKVADIKNIGGRWGGSITAAQFLQRFVEDVPWAHLDIAGTAMASEKSDINHSWGSGFGVRLLDRFVAEHYES